MHILKLSILLAILCLPSMLGCGPGTGTTELGEAQADPEAMTADEVAAWDSGETAGAPPEGE